MARVTISNELRDKILSAVTAKYNDMIEKKRSDFLEANKNELYRCIVPQEVELKALGLPSEIVQYAGTLYFKRNDIRYNVSFGMLRPLPSAYHYSYNSEPFIIKDPALDQAFTAMEAEVTELQAKVKKLHEDIKKILTTCRTLKQVLEVWPSALEFCPEAAKQRHAAPDPPRYKKGDVTLSDDTKLELVKVRML